MSAITDINEHRKRYWKDDATIPGGGIVYVTDDYDDAFSVGLLNEITVLFNNGMELEEIAEKFDRPAIEVLLALIYQADNERITRAFAYRRRT